MSLLLDALKKAAEEKKISNKAEDATVLDNKTELGDTDLGATEIEQATDVTATADATDYDATQVADDLTELADDQTKLDYADKQSSSEENAATQLDSVTELNDVTKLDADDLTSFDIEPMELAKDKTEFQFSDTEIGDTKPQREPTELEQTGITNNDFSGYERTATVVGYQDEFSLDVDKTGIDVTEINEDTKNVSSDLPNRTSLTDNFIKQNYSYSPKAAGSVMEMSRPNKTSRWRLYTLITLTLLIGAGVIGLFAYQYYIESSDINYKVTYEQLRPRATIEDELVVPEIEPETALANATTSSTDSATEQDEIIVREEDYTLIIDQAFDAIEEQSIANAAAEQAIPESETNNDVEQVSEPEPVSIIEPKTPITIKRRQDTQISNTVQQAYEAFNAGDMLAAKSYYQQALAQQANNRDALLGVAAISMIEGDTNTARNIYAQLLQENPSDSAALAGITSLGPTNQETAANTESISSIKIMLQQQPEAAQLHFALGNALADQARWAEAQQAFFEAFRRDETHPDYLYNLAVSLDYLGKYSTALNFYRQALLQSGTRPNNVPLIATESRINALQEL